MSYHYSALELASKYPNRFLSEQVFRGLHVEEFKFGPGESGNLGLNMISQGVRIPAQTHKGGFRPVTKGNELSVHLTCLVKASNLQNNTITIHIESFHITARSDAAQRMINACGPSVTTADHSIHMNVNTDWGRAENLKALAEDVGINVETLKWELLKQGYDRNWVRFLVKALMAKVTLRIQQFLGAQVVVRWKGDKTFPTQ